MKATIDQLWPDESEIQWTGSSKEWVEYEGRTEKTSEAMSKNLVLRESTGNEISIFNILRAEDQQNLETLTNLVDGLLETTPEGKVVPAIAESWETNDNGKTWTFHIRDGVKWVDVDGNVKADCTDYDFTTGLEWVLNFHKNDASNIKVPLQTIEGADAYFQYTKSLSQSNGMKSSR